MKKIILVLLGMFILTLLHARPNKQEKDYLIDTFRNSTNWEESNYGDTWNTKEIQFSAFYLFNSDEYAICIADWNTKDVLMLKLDKTDFFTYKKYFKLGFYSYIPFEKAIFP